jgi:hypothetical protein
MQTLAAAVGAVFLIALRPKTPIAMLYRDYVARLSGKTRGKTQQWLIFLLCSGAGLTIGRRIGRGLRLRFLRHRSDGIAEAAASRRLGPSKKPPPAAL